MEQANHHSCPRRGQLSAREHAVLPARSRNGRRDWQTKFGVQFFNFFGWKSFRSKTLLHRLPENGIRSAKPGSKHAPLGRWRIAMRNGCGPLFLPLGLTGSDFPNSTFLKAHGSRPIQSSARHSGVRSKLPARPLNGETISSDGVEDFCNSVRFRLPEACGRLYFHPERLQFSAERKRNYPAQA